MRHALLKNDLVVNIILVQPQNLSELSLDADAVICIEDTPEVGIGWLCKNGKFESPWKEPESI